MAQAAAEAKDHAKSAADAVKEVKEMISKPKKRKVTSPKGKTYTVEDA